MEQHGREDRECHSSSIDERGEKCLLFIAKCSTPLRVCVGGGGQPDTSEKRESPLKNWFYQIGLWPCLWRDFLACYLV